MFIKDHWYIAGFREEITDKPLRRLILGLPVVLFRTKDGRAVALEDRCIHRQVPLSMGSICDDGTLACLYHGIRYDADGNVKFIPEQTRIPRGAMIRNYNVVEKGYWLWIFGGEPEDANEADIPAYPWFEKPGWTAKTRRLHVNCNYKLIVDNLLNMAHLPYVHPRTIGSEGVVKDAAVKVTQNDNGVRLARKMYDIEPPPTYKKAGGFEGNVNRWQTIDWMAPSSFEFHTGVVETGHEPPPPDYDAPKINARILDRHAMHSIAPETEKSSNYYVAFSYDPEEYSEELAEFLITQMIETFEEDVVLLEAQQDNMDLVNNPEEFDIVSDGAGLQAMKKLRAMEAAAAAAD